VQRVTFDTNVFISALTHQGASARLLVLANEGAFALQLSEAILAETLEVLARDFDWAEDRIVQVRTTLWAVAQRVTPHLELEVVKRDPDDNRILECAQASKSRYIVTSDKDLLELSVYEGAEIIKPGGVSCIARVMRTKGKSSDCCFVR
jgi:uncharacterized protein